ncbi:ExbD/TolR family protein [Spirulina subsalsa]|uniref:ExbD/TolR family protein n=1 Tax=Spirulina subsalsa TaxID=54311 RepID=UPI0002D7C280|nr:biopolymer transporter ExbD [Spirulina subsalsa]
MRFKSQNNLAPIPRIDLIPMLNVMMAVLAFFVLISMLLTTAPDGVEVQLPGPEDGEVSDQLERDFFLVRLTATQQGIVNEEPFTQEQILTQIPNYLATVPDGVVVLVAEPDVPYEVVIQWLAAMKTIGGDRVSLGIEPMEQ